MISQQKHEKGRGRVWIKSVRDVMPRTKGRLAFCCGAAEEDVRRAAVEPRTF